MNESIQESIEKTEKLTVDSENPKYSTNWCDLPLEMRAECIKRMDFKSRTRLGATSHTEKSLVEANKFHFDIVKVEFQNFCFEYFALSAEGIRVESIRNHEKTLNCFKKILKNGKVDTIEMSIPHLCSSSGSETFWRRIRKFAPFSCKTVRYCGENPIIAERFLRNFERTETIVVYSGFDDRIGCGYFSRLFYLTPITNAKHVQFDGSYRYYQDVQNFVQTWTFGNVEVGKSIRFVGTPSVIRSFGQEFGNRVIYENDDECRIRTNDESKHILMRCEKKDQPISFYSCTVIPSNLLESEYEKDDQWIEDMLRENENLKLKIRSSIF